MRTSCIAALALSLLASVPNLVTGGDPALQPIPEGPPIAPYQGLGPAAPFPIRGIDCAETHARCRCGNGECRWEDARFIAWQAYAQGEYVGHAADRARARVPPPR